MICNDTILNKYIIINFVSFIQAEFFQDDLFPETRVTWQPTLTGEEWLDGVVKETPRISLQPTGMKKCKLPRFQILMFPRFHLNLEQNGLDH